MCASALCSLHQQLVCAQTRCSPHTRAQKTHLRSLDSGVTDDTNNMHLRLYLLEAPTFANATPKEGETALAELGDKDFLANTEQALLQAYQVRCCWKCDCCWSGCNA